jgi:hypothetical protein
MQNILKVFIIITILNCVSPNKFQKIQKLDSNKANLYLLRSPNPTLGLYKFNISIYKFEGNFKNDTYNLYQSINLDNSEYCFLRLEESYYNIKISKEDLSKIIYLENGKDYYFNFEIINRGFFSLPEYFLKGISKEEATKLLLEFNKMDRCSISMD